MRPVESGVQVTPTPFELAAQVTESLLAGPLAIDLPVQSAPAHYTAPGTRRLGGSGLAS